MNLKAGDTVKVKDHLQVGVNYDGIYVVSSMKQYEGKTLTIIKDETLYKHFLVKENTFLWAKSMFDLVDTKEQVEIFMKSLGYLWNDEVKVFYHIANYFNLIDYITAEHIYNKTKLN